MAGHVLNALKPLAPVKARRRSEEPAAVPVNDGSMGEAVTESTGTPAQTVYQSPFQIDHRGELIAEMRHDAAVFEAHAAEALKRAEALRISADHLEAHPPD